MRKSAKLSVRMSDDEIILLQELASTRSIRLSELVRRVLAEEVVTPVDKMERATNARSGLFSGFFA